ncbi:phosphoribosylamine--glycine ligase [Veillonella sp. CHU110]|uniref:phosphoribosylamine--glycine ligase n=1 Tax=Veillonella sp. CHU110 TaxID=2490947 RepID=UPI000F8D05C9|nr:phosphoribosylamine--glycine ligase [Veillonella sp. CHU110]
MKVCVIGSGGREHALVWKLHQSPSVQTVYAVPGSDVMASIATVVKIDWKETASLVEWLLQHHINLVVIGPEAPLVAGLSDTIRSAGIPVFGPSRRAAQLEGSKSFAKQLMTQYGIPTAKYGICSTMKEGQVIMKQLGLPIVIKADGLCAGKGVTICKTFTEGETILEKLLTETNASVLIEEYMTGEELSFLSFVDGIHVLPMIGARDHKRLCTGDIGPNTGGMGAYSPTPILTEDLQKEIVESILQPIVRAIAQEGYPYVGCLYVGLMITSEGPKVVEFNVRFGDPETQVILPLMESDLGAILYATATGNLEGMSVSWKPEYAATVMLASEGYPVSPMVGRRIKGDLRRMDDDILVFHSGTKEDHRGNFVTQGGRVVGVTAIATTLEEATSKAYNMIETIDFTGKQYRTDIGRPKNVWEGQE